jgi:DNA-binding winged helix-turn-helix (wHTH) protein
MRQSGGGFAFDAFLLDLRFRRLLRNGALVPLRPRHFELLHELVANAPNIVTKDRLFEVGWPGVVVEENTLVQAMSQLRASIDPDNPKRYIETVSGHGYRFVGSITPAATRASDQDLDVMLAPFRALVDGRAMIETLELERVRTGRDLFLCALQQRPDDATLHVGMANACLLIYESTRADLMPDVGSLRLALHHGQEASRLAPDYAEARATLGLALWCARRTAEAISNIRCAITMEPDNWRHYVRLGYASWGTERLWAAGKVLDLLPGCPIAHWLIATVQVALRRNKVAHRHIADGLAATPPSSGESTRFSVVGLHLLDGLLWLDAGEDDRGLEALAREVCDEHRGHVYSRECCAHGCAFTGAVHFNRGRRDQACHGFVEALKRIPLLPSARVGLMILGVKDHPSLALPVPDPAAIAAAGRQVEAAVANAVLLGFADHTATGAQLVLKALQSTPPGSAGWTIPIDPQLGVRRAPDVWAPVFAELRTRAS